MESLKEIHKKCHKIFKGGLFDMPEEFKQTDDIVFLQSRACKIFDKLTDGDFTKDDCIGENFNQLIVKVYRNWFNNYNPSDDLDYYFYNYFLLLYLVVERIEFIFQVINQNGKSKLFNDFQQQEFKTLRKINKWANFIKHPKEFLFTHWPTYYLEGDSSVVLKPGVVKIDTDFIFKHYDSEKKERPVILENNNRVFVEVPNLENLTYSFCNEINAFFDFICCNQIVADYLKKKSTIENYYSEDTVEDGEEDAYDKYR
jgi:hypothetical protein